MSTEKIHAATVEQILKHYTPAQKEREFRHLDIGSGSGELVRHLKQYLKTNASCCDYTDSLMNLPGQPVDIVNLNTKKEVPYPDNSFDIVTATEIIEHLEDFRAIMREVHRILKSGGIFVLSTPNILNINSRLRYLWFGFPRLMGPLPIRNRKIESCAGHINPTSLFYIMHALCELNFREIDYTVDKYQRSGMVKLIFLLLPIKMWGSFIWKKEITKYKTIDESNREIVGKINSVKTLLGRTIIVSAVKE